MAFSIPVDNLLLEARLREPAGAPAAAPKGAMVLCHPHPVYGGTMDNRVVYRAAKAASEALWAALRFNFRGVGLSTGSYDQGLGEQDDAAAAIQWLQDRYPSLGLCMLGYSFGAWVGLQVACRDARIRGMIGLGLPLDLYDFAFLSENHRPALYIMGTQDEFCSPASRQQLARRLPASSLVQTIEGADHYFSHEMSAVENLIAEFLHTLPTG